MREYECPLYYLASKLTRVGCGRYNTKETMPVTISDEVLTAAHISEPELKQELALTLFQQERLTLAQASRLAEMSQLAFQALLAERQIPIHYGIQEFREDLRTLRNAKFRFITEYRSSARTFGLCAKRNIVDRCLRYISRPESRPHRPSRTVAVALSPSAHSLRRILGIDGLQARSAARNRSCFDTLVDSRGCGKPQTRTRASWDSGPGETQAIVVAIAPRAGVWLVEERRGGRTASAAGLTVTGLIFFFLMIRRPPRSTLFPYMPVF